MYLHFVTQLFSKLDVKIMNELKSFGVDLLGAEWGPWRV